MKPDRWWDSISYDDAVKIVADVIVEFPEGGRERGALLRLLDEMAYLRGKSWSGCSRHEASVTRSTCVECLAMRMSKR